MIFRICQQIAKWRSMKKDLLVTFFFLVISFLLFYMQNRFAISCIDDWWYAFMIQPDISDIKDVTNDEAVRQPILSIYDAMVSQSRHYFITNGRYLVHTLVQYFCGVWGMKWFIVANSIMFSFLVLVMMRLVNVRGFSWTQFFTVLLAVWLIMPHKGLTFMGNISLSVNYLWVSVATLLFVLIIEHLMRVGTRNTYHTVCLCVLSLVAGSLQESFSIGISAALLCYLLYMFYLGKKMPKGLVAVIISYITGAMFCVLSPANFSVRASDISGLGVHPRSLLGLLSSPPVLLFGLLIVMAWWKGFLRSLLSNNYVLVASTAVNVLFVIFVAYNGRHQLTAINVMLLVVLLRAWTSGIICSVRLQRMFFSVFMAVALISYFPILKARKDYYDCYLRVVEKAHRTKTGIVDGKEFEMMTQRIRANRLLDCNYVFTFSFDGWNMYEKGLSICLTHGKSNDIVTTILPESDSHYYITR